MSKYVQKRDNSKILYLASAKRQEYFINANDEIHFSQLQTKVGAGGGAINLAALMSGVVFTF